MFRKEVLDLSAPFTDGAAAIIDDSFLRCFTSLPPDNWNWNLYLFPMWCIGVVVRHCILFPLRFILLMTGFLIFFILFFGLRTIMRVNTSHKAEAISAMCRTLQDEESLNVHWFAFSVESLLLHGLEL